MQLSGRFLFLLICAGLIALVGCSDDDEATQPPPAAVPMTLVAASRTGDIYTVSETDGSDTMIIDTKTEGNDLGVVSSMLYVQSTGAWWLGLGGNGVCPGCIHTLDPNTGESTLLADNSALLGGISGLAIHPSTGRIYTGASDAGTGFLELAVSTGVATEIDNSMDLGYAGKGCTFTSAGELYMFGDDDLYRIDVDALESTLVDTFTLVGFPAFNSGSQRIGSLTTRSDGVVFGILKDGGGVGNTSTTYLVRVDLATAQVTNVGANSALLDGIAYVPTAMIP